MITINYVPNATLRSVADGKVVEEAQRLVDIHVAGGGIHKITATFLLIDALRVAVKKGQLSPDDFRVLYKGQYITFDKNGRSRTWPKGFGGPSDDLLMELL